MWRARDGTACEHRRFPPGPPVRRTCRLFQRKAYSGRKPHLRRPEAAKSGDFVSAGETKVPASVANCGCGTRRSRSSLHRPSRVRSARGTGRDVSDLVEARRSVAAFGAMVGYPFAEFQSAALKCAALGRRSSGGTPGTPSKRRLCLRVRSRGPALIETSLRESWSCSSDSAPSKQSRAGTERGTELSETPPPAGTRRCKDARGAVQDDTREREMRTLFNLV
jgi:hypothetical protein